MIDSMHKQVIRRIVQCVGLIQALPFAISSDFVLLPIDLASFYFETTYHTSSHWSEAICTLHVTSQMVCHLCVDLISQTGDLESGVGNPLLKLLFV